MSAYSLLSNSIYIFTIVSAFFWLTHTKFSLENRRKVNVLIFFFVLLGTYGYWILGDRSFLSFSGDLEYSIPNFKTLSALPPLSPI